MGPKQRKQVEAAPRAHLTYQMTQLALPEESEEECKQAHAGKASKHCEHCRGRSWQTPAELSANQCGTVDPYRKSRLPYRPAAAKAAPPVPWVNSEMRKGTPQRAILQDRSKAGFYSHVNNTIYPLRRPRGHAEVEAAGQIGPAAGCCKAAAQHDQKQVRGSLD